MGLPADFLAKGPGGKGTPDTLGPVLGTSFFSFFSSSLFFCFPVDIEYLVASLLLFFSFEIERAFLLAGPSRSAFRKENVRKVYTKTFLRKRKELFFVFESNKSNSVTEDRIEK